MSVITCPIHLWMSLGVNELPPPSFKSLQGYRSFPRKLISKVKSDMLLSFTACFTVNNGGQPETIASEPNLGDFNRRIVAQVNGLLDVQDRVLRRQIQALRYRVARHLVLKRSLPPA